MFHPIALAAGVALLLSIYAASSAEGNPQEGDPMPRAESAAPPPPVAPGEHKPNRLIHESSPYLLQHAHNPVNWYPWGEEAFQVARDQNKLIFLSIGYSTCYWCHVMERESFENEETAAIMNDHFIAIKVDREERPDVDDIYMTATQLTTGQGGWPMSVFLEPQSLKPFLAGTYFPPQDKFGRPGFPSVLKQVAAYWESQRDAVMAQADRVAEAVKAQHTIDATPVALSEKHVEKAVADLLSVYDPQHGGFAGSPMMAPKFPTPVYLELLIGAAWDLESARNAVTHTLDRMAMGGMYDQIGGGFHRYSVDEKWLVPHFEKMLYDNSQLASLYARAHEKTGDPFYAEVVRETLDYVLREMTDAATGAFYSAQDAEVNTFEGGNYIWTADEVRAALDAGGQNESEIDFALNVYSLDKGTNFRDPHHPEAQEKNVLHLIDRPEKLAEQRGVSIDEFNRNLARINTILLAVRDKRDQPGTDDKVLTAWNGLMIAGFAEGGRVLKEPKYIAAAKRAAEFILTKMKSDDGGLQRTSREGEARINAFLEDYANLIHGLLALHRATDEARFLNEAKRLAAEVKKRFWDESSEGGGGAYFDTLEGQSDLFVRIKSIHDGATPSGNSMMLINLLDLHEATRDAVYLDQAEASLRALSSAIDRSPSGAVLSVLALDRLLEKRPGEVGAKPQAAAGPAATMSKPAPPAPRPGPTAPTKAEPVTITAEPVEVNVKPGTPATFNVVLTIVKPYHVNAHKPGDEFMVPLEIKLTGAQGLSLTADYPKGEGFKTELAESAIFVHEGTVTIPVRIEQTGTFSGTPKVHITYQVCTNKVCLEPKKAIVPVRIIAQR